MRQVQCFSSRSTRWKFNRWSLPDGWASPEAEQSAFVPLCNVWWALHFYFRHGVDMSTRWDKMCWGSGELSRPGASEHMQEEARTEHIGTNYIRPSSYMLSPSRKRFIDFSGSRDDSPVEFSSQVIRVTSKIDSIKVLEVAKPQLTSGMRLIFILKSSAERSTWHRTQKKIADVHIVKRSHYKKNHRHLLYQMSDVEIKNSKKRPQMLFSVFMTFMWVAVWWIARRIDFVLNKKRATTKFVDNIINLASFVSHRFESRCKRGRRRKLDFNVVANFSLSSIKLSFFLLSP